MKTEGLLERSGGKKYQFFFYEKTIFYKNINSKKQGILTPKPRDILLALICSELGTLTLNPNFFKKYLLTEEL